MKRASCFLSCSFREEDKDAITFFKHLLEDEFEVLTAEPEDSTDIYEKIFPKIRTSGIYFVIFSKRSKIEGADDWTPPPDALTETGFALALGRKVFGFVESGITERQLGLVRLSSTNYPRFNRSSLESERKRFSGYIKAAAEELAKIICPPWEYIQATKEVTVYPNVA